MRMHAAAILQEGEVILSLNSQSADSKQLPGYEVERQHETPGRGVDPAKTTRTTKQGAKREGGCLEGDWQG